MNHDPSRAERTRPKRIVATMLSGNNQDIVVDAVRSAIDFIHELILIDTGITDQTLSLVRQEAAGKLRVIPFPWCNDFAMARNFALQAAAEAGAAWALTLDTDERMDFHGIANAEELLDRLNGLDDKLPFSTDAAEYGSPPPANTITNIISWMVSDRSDTYAKERFILVPTHLRWEGRTHESLVGATSWERRVLDGCAFWEEPKDEAAMRHKLNRDLQILMEVTQELPDDNRWWYYLGQTLEALRKNEEAIQTYIHCAQLPGWSEQSAWACYAGARLLTEAGEFTEAEELCAYGLTRDATFPELPWLLGWSAYQRGDMKQAISWSEMSAALGAFRGCFASRDRIGFRYVPAWYEGPYDVLRFAYRINGQDDRAAQAAGNFEDAKRLRLQRIPSEPTPCSSDNSQSSMLQLSSDL